MTNYPKSDHFDGQRFLNLQDPVGNGLGAVFKMLLTSRRAPWPDYVPNSRLPDLHRSWGVDEIAVTFVNHATVLVQTRDFNFLTDPVWSDRVSPLRWIGPHRHRAPGVTLDELPRIDLVLISHNHYDHLDLDTVLELERRFHPRFVVPLGNRSFLERQGLSRVDELDWWESLDLPNEVRVSLTPAEHFSGRSPWDKNRTLWGSFFVNVGGHRIYFAGDTGYAPHFKATRERLGAPDLAFLPIGAYEPRWFMKAVHMNPAEAVQAHLDLKVSQSIGIHFGTFRLTGEPMDQPVTDLSRAREDQGVAPEQFITLGEGRTRVFKIASRSSTTPRSVLRSGQ